MNVEPTKIQLRGIVEMRTSPNAKEYNTQSCEAALRSIWGEQYEQNRTIFVQLLRSEEARRQGVIERLEAVGLDSGPE